MAEKWRFARVTEKHLRTPELQAFRPPNSGQLAEFLRWEDLGGRARVVYSGERIAGLLSISPEHALFAFVLGDFRRQRLATDGLRLLMDRIVEQRGPTRFVATTEIGQAGEAVARSLGMTEVSRTDDEIVFELKVRAART